MKRSAYFLMTLLIVSTMADAQNSEFKLENYTPPSPTAFQFLKYDEVPVSEYTGIPNISIPLYQIEEDGLTIPLTLTYHAGGIRISEEASWVGLGWNLQIGNIVQEINDRDDYDPETIRLQPSYYTSPIPSAFPYRFFYPWLATPGVGWSNPYPGYEPQPFYSFKYATAYYVPINGDFDNQYLGQQLFTNPYYDSEPDIFRASFLGHSFTFIRDPISNQIIVLNRQGYLISRNLGTYKIVVPSGDEFYFELNTTVTSSSQTTSALTGSGGSSLLPSSKVWMLTKIITRNKREILFNYSQIPIVDNYPNYSEKWHKSTLNGPVIGRLISGTAENHGGYIGLFPNTSGIISTTFSYSSENKYFLNSIVFPKGQINFNLSDRIDMIGGKKLDAIQISTSKLIKSYQFNYSNFDATAVGGNTYSPVNAAVFGNMPKLRLKLLSLQDNTGAAHVFTYNQTPLPGKNSFGQDFWGFYNGQISNPSLIPNPARLNKPQLGNNGNNNSANLTFCQAGILTEIKYPTGGKSIFEYELNQFDNYWVPDFSTTSNTISSGNGLRIHAINYRADDNHLSKRTVYNYEGGKSIVSLDMYKQYGMSSVNFTPTYTETSFYTIDELCGKGFFTTSALGSINGVGYDKVIRQEVYPYGTPNSRTETVFNNIADIVSITASSSSQIGAALPTVKHEDHSENGTVKSICYYKYYIDDQNIYRSKLLKKIENDYGTNSSGAYPNYKYYYGARIFSYPSLIYHANMNSNGNDYWYAVPQTLIGYYPIYDIESLLTKTTTTEYGENYDSLVTLVFYGHDGYHQLNSKEVITSTNEHLYEHYDYAYDYYQRTGNDLLWNSHRLTEIASTRKTRRNSNYYLYTDIYSYDKDYAVFGDKIAVNKMTINDRPLNNPIPSIITYDKYDINANPIQYTKAGETNSMLWDYNNEYIVADIKNAPISEIAYTSFEASGPGNWTFLGTPISDYNPPTGGKSYDLSAGNITMDSLIPSKTYVVTYWSRSGPQNVNSVSPNVTGINVNGWVYYKYKVTGASTITVTGSGVIDELRLYPLGAQMTSYTYDPLIGVTSKCDINNDVTYYEYDNFGRLKLIRDQNRKILKKYCYNYAGQTESCSLPTVYVTPSSVNYGLGSGYKATYTNVNTGAVTVYNISGIANSEQNLIYVSGTNPLPSGNYNLKIDNTNGNSSNYTFSSGCGSMSTDGTPANFYNISINSSTCKQIKLNP